MSAKIICKLSNKLTSKFDLQKHKKQHDFKNIDLTAIKSQIIVNENSKKENFLGKTMTYAKQIKTILKTKPKKIKGNKLKAILLEIAGGDSWKN